MDIAVLREVYIDKEYQWYPIIKPQVILDLGAHYGDTTLYYNALFPDAKIYAVEPSPENFERLNTHVKNIHNIIPLQFAIGSTNDTVELSVGNEPFGHSTVNTRYVASKTIVNQITLNKVFDDYKIEKADLIKFDIEGAEFSLFESINPKVFSKAYIGEIHLDLVDYPSLDKFTKLFNGAEVSVEEISKDRRYIIKALYI